MPFELYDTLTLLPAVEQILPVQTFLRDTFFPRANDSVELSEYIAIESKRGKRIMAPFVAPKVGGVTMDRDGSVMTVIQAPKIAPQRPITLDLVDRRTFGENFHSMETPQTRQAKIMGRDLKELTDAIARREEWMVRELLFTGKVGIKGYVDTADKNFVEQEIKYFDLKPATPSSKWNTQTPDILGDLRKWRRDAIKNTGAAPDIAIVSSDVSDILFKDETLLNLLDIERFVVGEINPVIENPAVTFLGRITALGIDVYTYDEWVVNDEGEEEPMVPEGHVLLGSRGLGQIRYAPVTQLENDQNFHTYQSPLVPKVWANVGNDNKMLKLTSRPVPVPVNLDSWVVAKVI